jgi:hypothetical protein
MTIYKQKLYIPGRTKHGSHQNSAMILTGFGIMDNARLRGLANLVIHASG